ncbi:MAG TPA: outer membrane beta-barrel protein, partial [Bacteroidia bacterium]
TGLQVNYDRGTLTFTDTANYLYDTKNQEILSIKDTAGKKYVAYKLDDRFYKTTYVMLPLYLKMKTKEIGAMTYYGEFGLNTGFRLKNKVNDNVTQYTTNFPKTSLTDLTNTDDMNLFKFALHIGGGAEYNLSGSTSLFFGLSYNLGFSNVLKKESKYLLKNDATPTPTVQNAVANNFALTVGILF